MHYLQGVLHNVGTKDMSLDVRPVDWNMFVEQSMRYVLVVHEHICNDALHSTCRIYAWGVLHVHVNMADGHMCRNVRIA